MPKGMLQLKIVVRLTAIYLLLTGCVSLTIERDPVKTEKMVKEFLDEKNKSFFKKSWNIWATKGYICKRSDKFLAYLCSVILNQDPYNENIDPEHPSRRGCHKTDVNFEHSIRKPAEIHLYHCPLNVKQLLYLVDVRIRYYMSRTHIKSSLFVYKSTGNGYIYPDAFVSGLDMTAVHKDYKKSKKLINKKQETGVSHYMPAAPSPEAHSLLVQRLPLIFSASDLKAAKSFEYLQFENQKSRYMKDTSKIRDSSVASLEVKFTVLDNIHYNFEVDVIHYRRGDCRRRQIQYEAWQFDARICTLMCPPAYYSHRGGLEKVYYDSLFLSSGPEDQSVVLYNRPHTATRITPKEVIYSIHRIMLQQVLQIERSKPRTAPASSDLNFGPSSGAPSPVPGSPEPSYFSGFSPDRRSSTSSASSADGKSSQTSFFGISSPDRRQSQSPGRSSAERRSAIGQVWIDIDRYVAEEATIEFAELQSVSQPYEHFKLAYAKDDMCSYPATLQTQLCKQILESTEFGYQLEDRAAADKSCSRRTIFVNLHDDEDLSSNSISLFRCPNIQAIPLAYYVSSSLLNKSVILFRKNDVFGSLYAEALITYTGGDTLEPIADSTDIATSSPLRFFRLNYLV